MADENKRQVPQCPKCRQPMTLKAVEHIMAPPAPTMVLKTYSCEPCSAANKK